MPKFLVLRFSSIGDIVLTTPLVRCLKQQVKDAEVHYLTKKVYADVIEHNPYIDKKFLLEDNLSSVIDLLKKEKYDYVIDLHHNLRTLIVKTRLGVKSFSFDKINFEKWMLVNFKIDRLPKVHIVDRYMDTVKSFAVKNDNKGLDYFITADDEKVLQQLPDSHKTGYIGFVIGAKFATKRLPVEKIISICKKIAQPIVLMGGKEDMERATSIMVETQNFASLQMYNSCGKYSLNESAALVKHATRIITHDTGLMHMAAAFKREIISVWGNTIPQFGMSPYLSDASSKIVQVKNLSCRPCSKLGFEKCPKGHFKCMMDIDENRFLKGSN